MIRCKDEKRLTADACHEALHRTQSDDDSRETGILGSIRQTRNTHLRILRTSPARETPRKLVSNPMKCQVVYSELSRTYSHVRSEVQNLTDSDPDDGPPLTVSSIWTSLCDFRTAETAAASKRTGTPDR